MLTTTKKTITVCAIAVAGLGACSSGGGTPKAVAPARPVATIDSTNGPTINVAGHGKVEGAPDTMTVSLGVTTSDLSAQSALEHNNERAAALIAALKSHGVADKDVQTSDLNVSPNYDNHGHITGYSASNTVTASVRDKPGSALTTHAGLVIDAAAATAGNDIRIDGIAFSIDNTSVLIAKARANAVKDAVDQAHQLAAAASVTIGSIRTIDDTGTQVPINYLQKNLSFAAADRAVATVPLEAGSQQLTVDVTVIFNIAS